MRFNIHLAIKLIVWLGTVGVGGYIIIKIIKILHKLDKKLDQDLDQEQEDD